jgi:hypothetical protein
MSVRVAVLNIRRSGNRALGAPSRAALLCIAMAGCMTLGDETEPPPAVPAELPPAIDTEPASLMQMGPARSARKPSRKTRPASNMHAPREKPAVPEKQLVTLDPDQLIGLSQPGVEKLMGTPNKVSDDHLSQEWVYSAPGCNFRIFFYPNLNAASFRALKYGGTDSNGAMLDISNVCVRKILTARANAD